MPHIGAALWIYVDKQAVSSPAAVTTAVLCASILNITMKLPVQKYKRAESRLDGILFFVAVAWLALSFLLVLLYHPGSAHAVQPHHRHNLMANLSAPPQLRLPLMR
jgi:hypothetical protein